MGEKKSEKTKKNIKKKRIKLKEKKNELHVALRKLLLLSNSITLDIKIFDHVICMVASGSGWQRYGRVREKKMKWKWWKFIGILQQSGYSVQWLQSLQAVCHNISMILMLKISQVYIIFIIQSFQ